MSQRKRVLTPFGSYLTGLIEDAKILKCNFYTGAGITKPYFYETLVSCAPPRDVLERMIDLLEEVLGPDKKRRRKLYDLAAASRGELPADIMDALLAAPETWDDLRKTLHLPTAKPLN